MSISIEHHTWSNSRHFLIWWKVARTLSTSILLPFMVLSAVHVHDYFSRPFSKSRTSVVAVCQLLLTQISKVRKKSIHNLEIWPVFFFTVATCQIMMKLNRVWDCLSSSSLKWRGYMMNIWLLFLADRVVMKRYLWWHRFTNRWYYICFLKWALRSCGYQPGSVEPLGFHLGFYF